MVSTTVKMCGSFRGNCGHGGFLCRLCNMLSIKKIGVQGFGTDFVREVLRLFVVIKVTACNCNEGNSATIVPMLRALGTQHTKIPHRPV